MNIISFRRTVPITATIATPMRVMLDLPGPYIEGIQVWTGEAFAASAITLRIIESPGGKIFPEPSATIRTPLTELPEGGWWNIITLIWTDLRIVVSGGPLYRVIVELASVAQGNIDVIVNLKVSAQPPDQTTLELLRELNQGIQRVPGIVREITGELVKAALQSVGRSS